jgi:hypothetical protein
MADHDDIVGGLPDVIRDSNRPIIIYQGPPPGQIDPVTSNALGLLAWLSLLTICLIVIGVSFWTIWDPSRDPARYSPLNGEGQPRGVANQVTERREINRQTANLVEYLERIQGDNFDRRRTDETHPLIDGGSGIDTLRRQWDAACRRVRARAYDRRIGDIETRLADVERRLDLAQDPVQRAELQGTRNELIAQRRSELQRRQTDSDPTLRCTPAIEAPACSHANADPWCNPELGQPDEFNERRSL